MLPPAASMTLVLPYVALCGALSSRELKVIDFPNHFFPPKAAVSLSPDHT